MFHILITMLREMLMVLHHMDLQHIMLLPFHVQSHHQCLEHHGMSHNGLIQFKIELQSNVSDEKSNFDFIINI